MIDRRMYQVPRLAHWGIVVIHSQLGIVAVAGFRRAGPKHAATLEHQKPTSVWSGESFAFARLVLSDRTVSAWSSTEAEFSDFEAGSSKVFGVGIGRAMPGNLWTRAAKARQRG